MPEPKQHTLEDDELFLVSFIMLALGNGILIAIALMIWRNQALDVDDELVRWVLAAIALRIFSLQLLRRCTDKLDLAVADTAMAFAAMLLSLIHGFVAGAVITWGNRPAAWLQGITAFARHQLPDLRSWSLECLQIEPCRNRGYQCRRNRTIRLPRQSPILEQRRLTGKL